MTLRRRSAARKASTGPGRVTAAVVLALGRGGPRVMGATEVDLLVEVRGELGVLGYFLPWS